VLPEATGAHYDYNQARWSTQCVFPADDGAWDATTSFVVKGITWQIEIGAPDFGVPTVGRHPALPPNLTGGTSDDQNAVSISVTSKQSPDGITYAYTDSYGYYTPQDHNNGAGEVTINRGLMSGTVDIWLTPSEPEGLVFRISGQWACD
jgi:hypothetical protein